MNLNGKLASWCEDEGLEVFARRDPGEEGEAKGCGLAGARFGLADDISAGDDRRDDLGLDVRWVGEVEGDELVEEFLGEAKVCEGFVLVEDVGVGCVALVAGAGDYCILGG